MYVCMYVCMYARMYVCVCVSTHIHTQVFGQQADDYYVYLRLGFHVATFTHGLTHCPIASVEHPAETRQ